MNDRPNSGGKLLTWQRFRGENFSNVSLRTDQNDISGDSNGAENQPLVIREEDPLELIQFQAKKSKSTKLSISMKHSRMSSNVGNSHIKSILKASNYVQPQLLDGEPNMSFTSAHFQDTRHNQSNQEIRQSVVKQVRFGFDSNAMPSTIITPQVAFQ